MWARGRRISKAKSILFVFFSFLFLFCFIFFFARIDMHSLSTGTNRAHRTSSEKAATAATTEKRNVSVAHRGKSIKRKKEGTQGIKVLVNGASASSSLVCKASLSSRTQFFCREKLTVQDNFSLSSRQRQASHQESPSENRSR